MNYLFYMTRYPGYGGIETVTSMIIPKILYEGSNITILSHLHDGDNPRCHTDGIELLYMPDNKPSFSKKNYEYAESVISKRDFDLIIYQDSYAYTTEKIVCVLAKKYSIPLFTFEHNSPLFIKTKRGLDPITSPKGFLRRILHPYLLYRDIKRRRFILAHSQKYVLLSKHNIPEFCHLIMCDEHDKRITYLNDPILPFHGSIEHNKQNVIVSVSRLVKEKGVDKMLIIWKQLAVKLPEWRFIIVGEGVERKVLENYVKLYNIPRVQFEGYANPLEYYRKAKIFWMASKYEGWGMTLIESMQQGCVPVAFNSYSAIKEIIDDGINGILIENNNLNEFECKTLLLASNPSKIEIMSRESIRKVKDFELDSIFEQWKKLMVLN